MPPFNLIVVEARSLEWVSALKVRLRINDDGITSASPLPHVPGSGCNSPLRSVLYVAIFGGLTLIPVKYEPVEATIRTVASTSPLPEEMSG